MSVVEVEGVSFAYEKEKVLEGISLEMEEGEFLAIIGPNGGGKSTLLKLLMGELQPLEGRIRVLGTRPEKARARIGYVPQNTNINLEFPIRVLDVVMMGNRQIHSEGLSLLDRLFPIRYTRTERLCAAGTLEKVGMAEFLDRRIGDLSGGQRQRVLIARALCAHPKLLIFDEPTASIDASGQKQIYDLLRELKEEMSVIVVSHDLSLITDYADKVLYLNRRSFLHDLKKHPIDLETPEGQHFCEVELMQMLGSRRQA